MADIPEGSDLSSIKFAAVKMVRVATERKSTIDLRSCEEAANRDPGGSMYCPDTQLQAPSTAYQVTYSYNGQPMASDEYGSRNFTFSVYLRPDELRASAREKLSERTMAKAAAADLFELTPYRAPVRQVVIDDAASKFCDRNVADGSWAQSDPKCENHINYKTISALSSYVTAKVDTAAAAIRASSAE